MKVGMFRLFVGCTMAAAAGCTTPGTPTSGASGASGELGARNVGRTNVALRSSATLRTPRAEHRHRVRPKPGTASPKPSGTETMQAVTLGGPVMTAPKVVPILFPGDPYDAIVRDFLGKFAGSSYWTQAVSEYGVGPVTILPAYVPTDAPPTNDGTGDWLTGLLANPPSGLPAPDDNTVYAIVFPAGWDADEGACVSFGADHWYTQMPSGQSVVFTQNPACPNGYLGMSGSDDVTDALSHEIVESVTDPTTTTYEGVNWALSPWASAAEGEPSAELADLCEFQPAADYVDPQIGYMVQRTWSNRSQAAGHDPCLPLLPSRPVYFNTEALIPDGTQTYPYGYTRGISIPPGHEATVAIRLHADGPIGSWALSAAEAANPHLSPDIYNELSFSWDEPRGRSGDVRHLTIKRTPPPDGGSPVFLRVAITSTSGTTTNVSWLVVGTE
jgi:hypothetical protein